MSDYSSSEDDLPPPVKADTGVFLALPKKDTTFVYDSDDDDSTRAPIDDGSGTPPPSALTLRPHRFDLDETSEESTPRAVYQQSQSQSGNGASQLTGLTGSAMHSPNSGRGSGRGGLEGQLPSGSGGSAANLPCFLGSGDGDSSPPSNTHSQRGSAMPFNTAGSFCASRGSPRGLGGSSFVHPDASGRPSESPPRYPSHRDRSSFSVNSPTHFAFAAERTKSFTVFASAWARSATFGGGSRSASFIGDDLGNEESSEQAVAIATANLKNFIECDGFDQASTGTVNGQPSALPVNIRRGPVIGSGGYAQVYCGINTVSKELLAIKEISVGAQSCLSEFDDVAQEFDLLRKLRHKNVIRYILFEHSVSQGLCRIAMEFMFGGSTLGLLHQVGPLPENILRVYAKGLIDGLAYIHSQGITHRDLKPANLLIASDGTVKLADFGCGKRITESNAATKHLIGTPVYMAPEFICGNIHQKSDVWGLACTLLELATGDKPWSETGLTDHLPLMFHIMSCNRGPHIPFDFSPNMRDFFEQCFVQDPEKRPSAAELKSHVWLNEAPVLPVNAMTTKSIAAAQCVSIVRSITNVGSGADSQASGPTSRQISAVPSVSFPTVPGMGGGSPGGSGAFFIGGGSGGGGNNGHRSSSQQFHSGCYPPILGSPHGAGAPGGSDDDPLELPSKQTSPPPGHLLSALNTPYDGPQELQLHLAEVFPGSGILPIGGLSDGDSMASRSPTLVQAHSQIWRDVGAVTGSFDEESQAASEGLNVSPSMAPTIGITGAGSLSGSVPSVPVSPGAPTNNTSMAHGSGGQSISGNLSIGSHPGGSAGIHPSVHHPHFPSGSSHPPLPPAMLAHQAAAAAVAAATGGTVSSARSNLSSPPRAGGSFGHLPLVGARPGLRQDSVSSAISASSVQDEAPQSLGATVSGATDAGAKADDGKGSRVDDGSARGDGASSPGGQSSQSRSPSQTSPQKGYAHARPPALVSPLGLAGNPLAPMLMAASSRTGSPSATTTPAALNSGAFPPLSTWPLSHAGSAVFGGGGGSSAGANASLLASGAGPTLLTPGSEASMDLPPLVRGPMHVNLPVPQADGQECLNVDLELQPEDLSVRMVDRKPSIVVNFNAEHVRSQLNERMVALQQHKRMQSEHQRQQQQDAASGTGSARSASGASGGVPTHHGTGTGTAGGGGGAVGGSSGSGTPSGPLSGVAPALPPGFSSASNGPMSDGSGSFRGFMSTSGVYGAQLPVRTSSSLLSPAASGSFRAGGVAAGGVHRGEGNGRSKSPRDGLLSGRGDPLSGRGMPPIPMVQSRNQSARRRSRSGSPARPTVVIKAVNMGPLDANGTPREAESFGSCSNAGSVVGSRAGSRVGSRVHSRQASRAGSPRRVVARDAGSRDGSRPPSQRTSTPPIGT